MAPSKLSENGPIIIIGLIASIIAIVVFVTGKQSVKEFLPTPASLPVSAENVSSSNFTYTTDLSRWSINYLRPQSIDLSENKLSNDWIEPPAIGIQRLYGVIDIAENTKVKVILDVLDDVESQIVFAFDNDIDFTDNISYKTNNGDISNLIEFQISYSDDTKQPYAIHVYYPVAFAREIGANRLHYYRASLREGNLNFGGENFPAVLLDDNADGQYSDLWNTEILIDFNKDGVIGDNEVQSAMSPIAVKETYYTISEIADTGENLILAPSRFGQVAGLVVDSQTNAPIQDAAITILPINLSTKTGLDGGYSIEVPEGYQSQVMVLAPNYAPSYIQPSESIVAGKSLRIDIALKHSAGNISNVVRLNVGDSYHFLTGESGYLEGGDFYFGFSDGVGKFLANNNYQQGIIDLGDIGDVSLDKIQPPTSDYYRFGVDAVIGHTYVSPAKQGEVGHYVIFRVNKMENGQYVEIEFFYR